MSDPDDARLKYVKLVESESKQCSRIGRRLNYIYLVLRAAVLAFGAAVPVATAAGATSWLVALFGALVVVTEGLQQLFKFREQAIVYFGLSVSLDREYRLFIIESPPYDKGDVFATLVERVEPMRTVGSKDILSAYTAEKAGDRATGEGGLIGRPVEPQPSH